MSDILIRGMEMPTRCYACPCADLEYYDCNLMPGTRIEQHKRLDDCPLVPVPEHGDLIDYNFCVENYELMRDGYGNLVYAVRMRDINNAPTIIPADPAEEGEG